MRTSQFLALAAMLGTLPAPRVAAQSGLLRCIPLNPDITGRCPTA